MSIALMRSDIETPDAITYETPGSHAVSPRSPRDLRRPALRDGDDDDRGSDVEVTDLIVALEDSPLPLTWKGETLPELTAKFDAAKSQRLAGVNDPSGGFIR
jgi:hypothetical protein